MKKNILSILSICLLAMPLAAQLQIKGKIIDSAGHGVEDALVSISYPGYESAFLFYRTDAQGVYSFRITDTVPQKLVITINALSYKKISQTIAAPFTDQLITLQQDLNELPPVFIKDNNTGIRRKGDTVSYSVQRFIDSSDKTIGDVIRKLPGMEVDASGRILYNGVPINYFYIDGDNLLDDRYNIATKSIPANLVDKVQVIEHNQHIKALNGIVKSDLPGVNISLKENARNIWINNAELGAGISSLYTAEINSMVFRKGFKAINTLKANNYGKDLGAELAAHEPNEPGVAAPVVVSSTLIAPDDVPVTNLNKSIYLFNNAKMLSVNDMFKTKKKLSLRVNGYLFGDVHLQQWANQTSIFLPGDTVHYGVVDDFRNQFFKGRLALTANMNTARIYFNNTLTFDTDPVTSTSSVLWNNQPVAQQLDNHSMYISNRLKGIRVSESGRIIEFFSDIRWRSLSQELTIVPGLFKQIVNTGQDYRQLTQHLDQPVFSTENYLTMRRARNKWLTTGRLGFAAEQKQLNSDLFTQQTDSSITRSSDTFVNRLNWSRISVFAETELRWQNKRTLISALLPFREEFIRYHDPQLLPLSSWQGLFIQPQFRIEHKVGNESLLTLRYLLSSGLGTNTDIFRAKIVESYRDIAVSNLLLPQTRSTSQSFNAGLSIRNSLKIFFLNTVVSYETQRNDFIQSVLLLNDIIRTNALPYVNSSNGYGVLSSMSKFLFALKTTLNLKYQYRYRQTPQLQNGRLFKTANTTSIFEAGLRTKFSSFLTGEYQVVFTAMAAHSDLATLEQVYSQMKQMITLECNASDLLSIKFTGQHYRNRQNGQTSSSFFWGDLSAKLRLRKSACSLELLLINIANTSQFEQLMVADNYASSTVLKTRPRSALLKVSFDF